MNNGLKWGLEVELGEEPRWRKWGGTDHKIKYGKSTNLRNLLYKYIHNTGIGPISSKIIFVRAWIYVHARRRSISNMCMFHLRRLYSTGGGRKGRSPRKKKPKNPQINTINGEERKQREREKRGSVSLPQIIIITCNQTFEGTASETLG